VDLYIAGDVVLSGINDTLYAQGNVIYNAGAGKLNQVPNSAFYFTGNFLNNNLTQLPFYVDLNPLLRSRGAVIADQGFPQVVGGVGKINFYSLQISKVLNTQKVDLTNQVTMFNKLKMVKGDLNVGSASIIFNSKDTASTIVNETDINRIYGTTGYLQIKQFLNSTLRSPARLGLTFNNLQDSVLVRRFFASQATAADGGIERYYEVRNSNGSVVGAFGESVYLDSTEINGHGQEANLRLFRSTDNGATWNVVTSTLDSNLNKVTAPNIQGITTDTVRYTIADFACANPPIDSLGADTSFCNGDSLLLNAGAGAGFTYLWSTGATTQTVWVFNTDTLWVQIENNRGCITRDTIVVTENGLPFVSLVLGQDTVTACPATPLGLDAGNAGANFLWSTSDTTQLISITHADTMLSYDTLWVVVTDSNGCANNDSIIFEKSPAPVVNLGGTRNICGGTNAVLNTALSGASGNVGPTFLWNTGASLPSITVGITGQYDVTVTNSYGCQSADTVQVNVAPSISLSAAGTNVTCNGLGNGAVTLTVGGGTPGFTYLWNNGTTTQNLSNVGPGTYNVTVTDALGCTANASTAITQPAALTQSISGTNVTCNGAADGTATFTVGGGSPGYTYLWSNGATTSAITNLGPGTYTVTATDANGCTVSNSRTITEPPVLTISLANQQNIGCNEWTSGHCRHRRHHRLHLSLEQQRDHARHRRRCRRHLRGHRHRRAWLSCKCQLHIDRAECFGFERDTFGRNLQRCGHGQHRPDRGGRNAWLFLSVVQCGHDPRLERHWRRQLQRNRYRRQRLYGDTWRHHRRTDSDGGNRHHVQRGLWAIRRCGSRQCDRRHPRLYLQLADARQHLGLRRQYPGRHLSGLRDRCQWLSGFGFCNGEQLRGTYGEPGFDQQCQLYWKRQRHCDRRNNRRCGTAHIPLEQRRHHIGDHRTCRRDLQPHRHGV
jgi:hypothetical protein